MPFREIDAATSLCTTSNGYGKTGQGLTFQVTCVGQLGQLLQFLRCLWLFLPGLGLLRWRIPRTHLSFRIQRLQPDANGYLISENPNKKLRGKKLIELYEEKGMKRLAESGHNYFRVPFAIYVYFLNYKMSTYQIATQTFERCKAKIYEEQKRLTNAWPALRRRLTTSPRSPSAWSGAELA